MTDDQLLNLLMEEAAHTNRPVAAWFGDHPVMLMSDRCADHYSYEVPATWQLADQNGRTSWQRVVAERGDGRFVHVLRRDVEWRCHER